MAREFIRKHFYANFMCFSMSHKGDQYLTEVVTTDFELNCNKCSLF